MYAYSLFLWMAALLVPDVRPQSQPVRAPQPFAGGTYKAWRQRRAALLRDPSLLRFYTFEGVTNQAEQVPDLADKEGALSYRLTPVPGAPEERLTVIAGRWPQKPAVRMDRGVFRAEPFAVDNKTFTVEMWFRKNSYGTLRGNSGATDGTLVSQGNGYWDGWRVTTSYPEQTLGFEIGRPQPSSSFGFFDAGPLPDGVWHHLAVTWGGREMRMYLNGLLARAVPYDGDYTPPKPGDGFRIGYADAGWGSTKLDVDEVAVYSRALSPGEVLQSSLFYASLPDALAARLEAGSMAFEKRDYQTAAAGYGAILKTPGLHPDVVAVVRLRLGECLRERGDNPGAAREFAAVLNAPGIADRFRRAALTPLLQQTRNAGDAVPPTALERLLAMPELAARDRYEVRLSLARSLRRAWNFAAARKQYAALLNDPETSPRDRLNLRLEMAHSLREAGNYRAARAEYGRLAAMPDAPASLRSYARLLAAETYVRGKNWRAARTACRQLLATPDLPSSHRLEAEETMREIDRLQKGLTAHDPASSRIRLPEMPKPAVVLFVAPNGSDRNAGTARRPLATFAGAQRAIRALKRKGPLPAGGVAVTFRGGEYRMAQTLRLTAEDSGTAKSPIVYRAAPGATVRFTGGVRLRGFQPITDPNALARLPAEARGRVMQADLRAQGITDFGQLFPHGYGFGAHPVTELFFNGQAMRLARWPNEGWAKTGRVIEEKTPEGGFTFEYEGDRPARWAQAKDVWLFGYWRWLWADDGVRIASVDPQARRIRTADGSAYGIQSGMPFYAYNLLEELDAPGEWYLDRTRGLLYFYPPSDPAKAAIRMSMLSAPFVQMDGVSYVAFERLVFELGRTDGVIINNGSHCLLEGCTIRQIGGTAVTMNEGRDHGVFGCDLYTLGRGGAAAKGGDRRTLTPGGHFVENCHIYDFSRWDRTYTPAVWTDGVGTRIAHNLIHDSPGHAMRLEGNDHVVEFNEVHDVVYETDDQGALDMFFNPSYRGVKLLYNFWHHIGDGTDRLMRAGIRLDDAISGVLIYGNVFYKSSEGYFGGVQIHGGKENVVDNNLFIRCKYGISFSGWGPDRWKQFLASPEVVNATTQAVDIRKPPYSTRYPALAHLAENEGVNMVWRNVAYNCGEFLTRDRNIQDTMDNLVTGKDPGFLDARHRDFRLRPDSPVYGMTGFRPIPFGEIGLYPHPLRASWPVRNAVGRHYRE
jgi:hypothetical protein